MATVRDNDPHPEDADLDDGSESPTAPAPPPAPGGIEHTFDDAPADPTLSGRNID